VAADVASETRSGIGARLRAGRERSKLSLLQAAEKLHVDPQVLEALEAERFGDLGATVFVRGHLRRYAELVRESQLELQNLYTANTVVPGPPDLTRVPSMAGDPRRPLIGGVMVIIAVGVIGSAWWVIENYRSPLPIPVATAPESAKPPAQAPPRTQGPALVAAPVPAPVPAAVASVTPGSAAPSAPVDKAESVAAGAHRPDEADHRTVAITLHFTSDSWAEVYDGHGERLFYDIGSADSVRKLSGLAPLRVVLGNAPGVALEVNGHAMAVPSGETHDGSAQFQVSRSGRVMPARLAGTDGQRR
jgi:cytoskeleton protein RodZ